MIFFSSALCTPKNVKHYYFFPQWLAFFYPSFKFCTKFRRHSSCSIQIESTSSSWFLYPSVGKIILCLWHAAGICEKRSSPTKSKLLRVSFKVDWRHAYQQNIFLQTWSRITHVKSVKSWANLKSIVWFYWVRGPIWNYPKNSLMMGLQPTDKIFSQVIY